MAEAEYQVKKAGEAVITQPGSVGDVENYVINLDHEDVKSKNFFLLWNSYEFHLVDT